MRCRLELFSRGQDAPDGHWTPQNPDGGRPTDTAGVVANVDGNGVTVTKLLLVLLIRNELKLEPSYFFRQMQVPDFMHKFLMSSNEVPF